ncbi:CHAP domain-containing protein, partial [Candidatus Saccharibacteria bacterium]|nr:CHAP domain-containing protein [Candidatus Saccharibacteria bacterium]
LLYQENQVKTLELLVSSSSLSDFVNKQEYISKIGEKIDASIADIKVLKDQLEQEYKSQQQLAAQQQAQADNLAAQIAEQQRVLNVTKGEESKYQELIASDQSKRAELEAQQAAAIAAAAQQITYTGGDGSYPWSGVSFPSFQSDPWGFYLRQCTSYAAWKRASIGKAIPAWGTMGPADAKMWVGWANSFGYSVDQDPQYGDVAVYQGGVYGHVGIVEEVLDGGNSVRISEYNAQFDGQFSYSVWPTSSLMFIH